MLAHLFIRELEIELLLHQSNNSPFDREPNPTGNEAEMIRSLDRCNRSHLPLPRSYSVTKKKSLYRDTRVVTY